MFFDLAPHEPPSGWDNFKEFLSTGGKVPPAPRAHLNEIGRHSPAPVPGAGGRVQSGLLTSQKPQRAREGGGYFLSLK